MLTVIIPTFNEMKNDYLPRIFFVLNEFKEIEILFCDGDGQDGSADYIEENGFTVIRKAGQTRAERLNTGILAAKNEWILLHHPRSLLCREAIHYLLTTKKLPLWGAFTHQFDHKHPLLQFTSWYSNRIRGDLRGIFYLDHCLFIQKKLLFKCHLLDDIPIFEDTKLCLKLRRLAPPTRLPFTSLTSATRFLQNGIFKQAYLNQKLKWRYYLKKDWDKMNREYEKKTELNNKYE